MKRGLIYLFYCLFICALLSASGCASTPVTEAEEKPRPLAIYDIDTDTAVDEGLAYPMVEGVAGSAGVALAR